ncbi:hypothetical protein ACWD4V_32290 [Streptomyces tsukubensis]
MIGRIGWKGLPPGLRAGITARVGAVHHAATVADGLNCRFAATVTTERHGGLFLKGVPDGTSPEAAAIHRETLLNPAVTGVGPGLRYDIRTDGWQVLAFERIDGRHADLGPVHPEPYRHQEDHAADGRKLDFLALTNMLSVGVDIDECKITTNDSAPG